MLANGSSIARQTIDENNDKNVSWEFQDASGQSVWMSGRDGTSMDVDSGSAETDALGNNVGTHGSFTSPPRADSPVSPFDSSPVSGEVICNRYGIVGACSLVEMLTGADGTFASRGNSLPTEVDSNWNTAAGKDYRGLDQSGNPAFLWTSQEYDWKGRVTKEINTDGTFKSISYTGKVITETDQTGKEQNTFIPANGVTLATQTLTSSDGNQPCSIPACSRHRLLWERCKKARIS